ncbi:MAG: protein kinase [Planctomycetota bacterium]
MKAAFVEAAVGQRASESPTVQVKPEVALREGQIIGKCAIIRELGRGGMGAVYLAKHTTLDVLVAVKVLPASIAKSGEFAERFLREARLVATLRHPNVLAVMDADKDPATGLYYMVMEYVDGGSIADRLARGPMTEKSAAQVVNGIAKALSTAEKQGVIHRDIKPANILVTKDGRVKLADLGLAKRAGQADITQSSSALGTPFYMSPEQIQDSKRVDIRSDIYSLGATFFHMMTGRPPYPGNEVYNVLHAVMTSPVPDPRSVKSDLSESNSAICMKMLDKDASKRYQTPSDVLSDLVKSAAGGVIGLELEPMAPLSIAAGTPPTPLAVSGQGGPPTPVSIHEQGRVVIDMSAAAHGRSKDKFAILAGIAMLAIFGLIVVTVLFVNYKRDEMRQMAELALAREKRAEEVAKAEAERNRPADPRSVQPPDPVTPKDPGVAKPADPPPSGTSKPSPIQPPPEIAFTLHQGALLVLDFEADPNAAADAKPVRDQSGASRDGVFRGVPKFAEGKVGRGISFDGMRDSVEFPPVAACSIAMWVKSGIPLQQGWFDAAGAGAGLSVGMFQPRGITGAKEETKAGVFVSIGGCDAAIPFDPIASGWHHVIVSWNGATEARVTIDGRFPDGFAVGSPEAPQPITLPRPPAVAAAPAILGATLKAWNGIGRAGFMGTMDEVVVWDRALTVMEMEGLWVFAQKGESYCAEIAKRAPKPPPVEVAADPKPVDPKPEVPKPVAGKALSDGCVLALSFEDQATDKKRGVISDLSGKGNDASKFGSSKFGIGRLHTPKTPDQAMGFDGVWRDADRAMLQVPPIEERAIAFWFKCSERRAGVVYDGGTCDRRDSGFLVGVHLAETWDFWDQDKDGVSLGFWQNDVIVPVDDIFDGWHHLALSWDGDRTVLVAVDGKISPGSTWAGALGTFETKAKLARRPAPANNGVGLIGTSRKAGGTEFAGFRGMIDEFAIWDRPLTVEELTSLAGYADEKKSYCEEIQRHLKAK